MHEEVQGRACRITARGRSKHQIQTFWDLARSIWGAVAAEIQERYFVQTLLYLSHGRRDAGMYTADSQGNTRPTPLDATVFASISRLAS
jgi:hypothetical protein